MPKSIFEILSKRYPANAYALMEEVSDAAGSNRSRSADYISVGLWPSRGLHITGIELKSFRSDWLSELKNPKKAENIFQYCDYFWLLTTNEGIAKPEEIPDNWGWMTIKSERIYIRKEAPKLAPKELSRNFLASMLKRANDKSNYIRADSIEDRIKEVKETTKLAAENNNKHALKEYQELRKSVQDFEQASGIRMHDNWSASPGKSGEAVRFIINGGAEQIEKRLLELEQHAEHTLKSITNSLSNLKTEIKQDI